MKFFIVSAHVEHELGNNIFFFFYMIDGKKSGKSDRTYSFGEFHVANKLQQ